VKNSSLVRIGFDFAMVILLLMIYSVSAAGPLFHEIAGLVIFTLFSIHLFYNRKWIVHALLVSLIERTLINKEPRRSIRPINPAG
jgi:FtsH-binding integral membrane protein